MNPSVLLALAVLCVALGFAFWQEKLGFLIPGLKKMDPEKMDIRKVYRTNAIELFIISGLILLEWLGIVRYSNFLKWLAVGLMIATLAAAVVYEKTGNRFAKNR